MNYTIKPYLSIIIVLLTTQLAVAQQPTTAISDLIDFSSYTMHIPKHYLNNAKFKYGLERVPGKAYTRDVFTFQQYALIWTNGVTKGYFKYMDNKKYNIYEPVEAQPTTPVGFLIGYRNIEYEYTKEKRTSEPTVFDIAWFCKPSNIQDENIPLLQLFKDIMREKVSNSSGALKTKDLHLIMPNRPNEYDPAQTKILLWNNSHAEEVSYKSDRQAKIVFTDTTYRLLVPDDVIKREDFRYGLRKGEVVSADKMAYVFNPMYSFADNKKIPFTYLQNKMTFTAGYNNTEAPIPASFVLSFLGNDIQPSDLDFQTKPTKGVNRPISQLFIDFFINNLRNNENIKKTYLIYDKQPDPEEEGDNRMALWNDAQIADISFDVPSAYFYIDMSKTIDRDVLIKELEEQMLIMDKNKIKFMLYVSNAETPLIAENLKEFKPIMLRLWTLSPPAPSIGYDSETIKIKIGPDIEFLAQNDVDFHFYTSDNLCNNSLSKLITSILSGNSKEKTNVFIHLEAQDKNENTYFSKCTYKGNQKELNPNCLKLIRDRNIICECK